MPERAAGLSVVIATRGRPELLADTVSSLLDGDVVPEELIVADQSATRHPRLGAVEEIGGTRVVYVHTPASIGLSAGRNAALRAATTARLAFLDDDMRVDRRWLAALDEELTRRGPAWAVTGRVVAGEAEGDGGFQVALRGDEHPQTYAGPLVIDVLTTGNMALFRSAVERIGAFDERLGAGARFRSAEDNDYGHRLLRLGMSVAYVPAALVEHRAWRPASAYLGLRWDYGIGQGAFYAKHARRAPRHIARRVAWHVAHYARALPRRALREPRRALGDLVFLAGLATGAARWRAR